MKRTLSITALSFSLFAAVSAFAADGYVTGNVSMYAGPDTSYPSVMMLGTGEPVAIEGCVNGWSWCDVITGDNRGWVPGSYLQEDYQGQRVLVPSYGVQIGIPIVTFVFAVYWDDYYRNRSWYGERERWSRVTPQYRPIAASNVAVSSGSPSGPRQGAAASSTRVSSSNMRSTSASSANAHSASTLYARPGGVAKRPAVTSAHTTSAHTTHAAVSSTRATHSNTAATHAAVSHTTAPQHVAAARTQRTVTARAPQKSAPAKLAPKPKADDSKDQH